MTDLAYPSLVGASQVDWKLERNVVTLTNPLSRTIQRIARGGDRWRATVQVDARQGDDALRVCAWLDQISRGDNRGLLPVLQNDMVGTESAAFGNLFQDWSSSAVLNQAFTNVNLTSPPFLTQGILNVMSGPSAGYALMQSNAATTGLYHNITIDVPPQFGSYQVLIGDGLTTLATTGSSSAFGRLTYLLASSNSNTLQVYLYAGDGTAPYQHGHYGGITCCRAYTVEAAAAAGDNAVVLQGGVVQLAPVIKMGQFFCIKTSAGWELKRCVSPCIPINSVTLNGVAVTHLGRTVFEPALRGSVAAVSPVITFNPWARMVLADASSVSSVTQPLRHAFSFDLIEDVT